MDQPSCVTFAGYHGEFMAGASPVSYAVIPTCATPSIPGVTALESQAVVVSHELIEAATDARPRTAPAYHLTDVQSPFFLLGAEVGDLCFGSLARYGGFVATQVWSTTAAAQGNNPCIPAANGDPYYNVRVQGAALRFVRPGEHVDVPITGWSAHPVGDWTLQLDVASTFSPGITATVDTNTLNACQTTTLHIDVPSTAPMGGIAGVSIFSSRSPLEWHISPLAVMIGDGSGGSCTIGSICLDFQGFPPGTVMSSCTGNGTYSTMACPTANRVARCVMMITSGGVTFTTIQNFYPPTTTATVMQICMSMTPGVTDTYLPN
jgi:hypothetical protein